MKRKVYVETKNYGKIPIEVYRKLIEGFYMVKHVQANFTRLEIPIEISIKTKDKKFFKSYIQRKEITHINKISKITEAPWLESKSEVSEEEFNLHAVTSYIFLKHLFDMEILLEKSYREDLLSSISSNLL